LLSPKFAKPGGMQPSDLPFLAAAVEQTREQYAVSQTRTALLGRGDAGGAVWLIAVKAAGTYRGLASDKIPGRLPANDADKPLVPLLFGEMPEGVAEGLSRAGYPYAALDLVSDEADAPVSDEAAEAILRWATTLDRI
jgi:hypothetical protein